MYTANKKKKNDFCKLWLARLPGLCRKRGRDIFTFSVDLSLWAAGCWRVFFKKLVRWNVKLLAFQILSICHTIQLVVCGAWLYILSSEKFWQVTLIFLAVCGNKHFNKKAWIINTIHYLFICNKSITLIKLLENTFLHWWPLSGAKFSLCRVDKADCCELWDQEGSEVSRGPAAWAEQFLGCSQL